MQVKTKTLAVALMAAGFVAVAGSSVAGDVSQRPISLTHAQMDQVVAGDFFTDTYTTTTTAWFHGYSKQPAAPNSRGSSQVEFTDTYTRTLDCPGGNINSCYGGASSGLNPNTTVVSSVLTSSTSTILSGPGMR